MDTGYAKSSVHEDLMVHVLHAIIEGLDEHLRRPEDNHRHKLATVFTATFSGCFGVGDVKEYHIKKPKDSAQEKRSWSGGITDTSCLEWWITLADTFIVHWIR